jgi:hypothetical protein
MEVAVIPLLTLSHALKQGSFSAYWVTIGALRLYGLFVGLLILDESRFALVNVRIKLYVQAAIGLALMLLGFLGGWILAFTGVSAIANSAIWLAYFYLSKRVKLTLDPPHLKP